MQGETIGNQGEMTLEQRAREVEKAQQPDDVLVLSNGIEVRPRPLPPLLLQRIASKPAPKPPVVEITGENGKVRREENPFDPRYLEALEQHQVWTAQRILDAIILRGLEIVAIPDGVPHPEDDSWLEDALYFHEGENLDLSNRQVRFLLWAENFLFASAEDLVKAQGAVLRLAGATEEDIRKVEETFRSQG